LLKQLPLFVDSTDQNITWHFDGGELKLKCATTLR